ncbi:MAG: DUF305 domain-containing protein [Pyrinomonadaceae bacterium]
MKFNRTKLIGLSALVVALSIFVSNSRAQQMGDMPYDLHFIDMMIIHHQQGLEMAQMVETKSKNARLKTFAQKLAADQRKDIDELQGHHNHWYAGKPPMDPAMMESMMQSMHPGMNMDMDDTRRKLLASEGTAFDHLFLDTMIHHHQMAIGMAKEATTKAQHAEIKDFARKAVVKQQAQITEMNRLKGVSTTRKTTKPKAVPKTNTHKHGH